MNSNFTLRFEIPGVTPEQIMDLFDGWGQVKDMESGLALVTPLVCDGEIDDMVVRQSSFPLRDSAQPNILYVDRLDEIGCLVNVASGSGMHKLLCASESIAVAKIIDSRLSPLKDSLEKSKKVFIFAAHLNGAKCANYCREQGIEVLGFVDNDSNKHGSMFHGIKVLSLREIDRDAIIINASGRYCVEINEQLLASGYEHIIDFMEFLWLYDLPFQAESGFRKYVSEAVSHRGQLASLYCALADDKSRDVLDGIVQFRLTLQSTPTKNITSTYSEEFFAKDVLSFGSDEVFVDGGAYDGDSFFRFKDMTGDFKHAYLFEPDGDICRRALENIGDDSRVSVCNYGLWSCTAELFFSSTGGMDGSLAESGEIKVEVVSVDEFINDKVSFMKLDVEGAEEEALNGAKKHIAENRPKMAVALYHRSCDLWELPSQIEKLGGRFEFSLRHYSQTIDDSIIYAIPST